MSLTLDGQNVATVTNASTVAASLTTANANDIIVAIIAMWCNTNTASVSGVTYGGTAMTKRSSRLDSVGQFGLFLRQEVWYLAVAAAGTATITASLVNFTNNVNNISVFGVTGADQVNPWDANGALPALAGVGSTTDITIHNVTFSTTNANTFLIASLASINGGYFGATPDTGYTIINGINLAGSFLCTTDEYKVVAAAQSSVTLNIGNGVTTRDWIGMVDAIQQAAAIVPDIGFNMPMMGA